MYNHYIGTANLLRTFLIMQIFVWFMVIFLQKREESWEWILNFPQFWFVNYKPSATYILIKLPVLVLVFLRNSGIYHYKILLANIYFGLNLASLLLYQSAI